MVKEFIRLDSNYSFEKELEKGKECEKHFYDFFTFKGYSCEFVDKKDVDFILTNKCKKNKIMVDVKRGDNFGQYDFSKQRMTIEDIQNIKFNTDGWFRYDKDDLVICLDDIINHKFYMYKIKDLREYINIFSNDKSKVIYNKLYNSMCYFVYIEKFLKWLKEHDRSCRVFFYAQNN